MRVVLLSQYYFPEPVEKVHDLARGLLRLGHDVDVLTSYPCYPRGEIYPGYHQGSIQREQIEGVPVWRVPQIPDHSRSPWKRAIYYGSFALSGIGFGIIYIPRPDVLLVYQAELPAGAAGWVLSRFWRIPMVLDVVDLWPESVEASGMLRNAYALAFIRVAAKLVYKKARRLAVVTEGFRQRLIRLGVAAERMTVIHNWVPADSSSVVNYNPAFAAELGLAGKFNIMYAGNMGVCQDLETVINAAAMLGDLPEVQFVFVGDGVDYSRLLEIARRKGLGNVRFLGRKDPAMMPSLYALADGLLVHLKSDSLSEVSIPSKTFAYMASGRPVLMAVKGDAERFALENGFGLAVRPSDPAHMAEMVRRLYAMPAVERTRMGQNGVKAFREKYCSEVQVKRFERVLSEAVA